jgi:hypothetical protein
LHPDFADEVEAYPPQVQVAIVAAVRLLQQLGPHLKRPHCDTLKGSRYTNMKELRFDAADGVWRVAFAFDPNRRPVCWSEATNPELAARNFTKP